ncbi:serine hydroxymethyltransferase 4-like [Forsythia ovata]|uniref:Serine hydroxymethyltransferase 4-like n=1 Tax=Forsythia ovata TaxID=205694 RepID=A0ABD1PJY5_9LAMI
MVKYDRSFDLNNHLRAFVDLMKLQAIPDAIMCMAFSPTLRRKAISPGFKAYAKQVRANAVALGNYLMSKEYKLVTGGTENHLVLWDLRPLGLTGNKVEKLCDLCNITVNKNAVFGDSSALAPGGVRIGKKYNVKWDLRYSNFSAKFDSGEVDPVLENIFTIPDACYNGA